MQNTGQKAGIAKEAPLVDFEITEVRWPDGYFLIDSGNRQKLEKFGPFIVMRPEPQALWPPNLPESEWIRRAHMRFEAEGSHNGTWHRVDKAPDHWYIEYRGFAEPLRFRLALTGFKHLGLFPEQAPNWEFVYKHCEQIRKPTVLNLFAYTGGASLAAARAGAQVTHVDAVRQIVAWARDNAERNGFMDMRWLVDDVMKFVKREQRRGSKYTGIILDPPAFGHGPKGERWVLEEHLNELISILPDLLHPHGHFLLLNSYSLGYSPVILAGLLKSHFDESALKNLTCGELLIPETEGNRLLPAGVFARLHSDFAGSSHHKRT